MNQWTFKKARRPTNSRNYLTIPINSTVFANCSQTHLPETVRPVSDIYLRALSKPRTVQRHAKCLCARSIQQIISQFNYLPDTKYTLFWHCGNIFEGSIFRAFKLNIHFPQCLRFSRHANSHAKREHKSLWQSVYLICFSWSRRFALRLPRWLPIGSTGKRSAAEMETPGRALLLSWITRCRINWRKTAESTAPISDCGDATVS